MKLPRTIGLAIAVSLVAAPASISGAAAAAPTAKAVDANAVDADVSLVKPPPCTEQFWKRGHAVPPPLSEATHGHWY